MYATEAGSSGARSTTGCPAANASIEAIVRGIATSNSSSGGKLLAHVRGDALRHLVPILEHREQDAVEHQRRIGRRSIAHGAEDLRRGLQRERLALERHDHVLAVREHAPRHRA